MMDNSLPRAARAKLDTKGSEQRFTYTYLPGSKLLQTLTQPNGVALTQSYEAKRNLLTDIVYSKDSAELVRRRYTSVMIIMLMR